MSFGALAFLNPWLLAALASLPLIYWLLRTVPPRPKQIEFPPTRILVGLENVEKTPAKTPWWLLLIRLLAAALVIFALSEPVLNPDRGQVLSGSGPVVIAVDNGWAAAPRWSQREVMIERLIGEAESQSRPVVVLATAAAAKSPSVRIEAPVDARATAAALQPQPFVPDRAGALKSLTNALAAQGEAAPSVVWLTDGIDHAQGASEFAKGLQTLAKGGTFAVVDVTAGGEPLGLVASVTANGKLSAKVLRAGGAAQDGNVLAFSAKGQRLGEAAFKLGDGADSTTTEFELPLELRNQVTRVEIASERSAAAVSLLDNRSQWQRVGLLSGEAQEKSQPLLAPLYYIEKAVQPFAEVIRPKDLNLASGIDAVLKQNATVLMLADIGTLSGEVKEQVENWVAKGGVLVRFAGPRLEKGGDDLMPVPLRLGGRTLGGALSWSTPQPLAAFDDASLFTGLAISPDITINRQVLADPARLTPEVKVWARLKDGTPLVTASKRGNGENVLFHVTANSDWSNLPISGLFVEMLRRITQLGGLGGTPSTGGDAASGETTAAPNLNALADALAPIQTLDGYGSLKPPPPTAQAVTTAKLAETFASLDHPPGYYGPAGNPRAINVLTPKSVLAPLPSLPSGTERLGYESKAVTPMKPWLLAAALALIFADIIAVLILQGGLAALLRGGGPRARTAATMLALALFGLHGLPAPAQAQVDLDRSPLDDPVFRPPPAEFAEPQPTPRTGEAALRTPNDLLAQTATAKVTFGYVLTGDSTTDQTSRLGLNGLGKVLSARTAVEPGDAIGVDIIKDEVAFFPILYWPVLDDVKPLPEATLAKIDAYMKQGGIIIFDTRDYGQGVPTGMPLAGERGPALQRLLGSLDLPRLEPVPEDHVLTKAFYLLRTFPGRWDGGQLWVEATDENASAEEGSRKARRADGVSSIMVTSNDLAAAWAFDSSGRPIYPVVPGGDRQREMSLRTGINIVMHALTGNYKADQVHVPALLERLGQ